MEVNLIFGPPGTGKTTRLLKVLEDELQKVGDVNKIAYVTFTKEGAEQGAKRSQEIHGQSRNSVQYFRTLHSLAFRELGLSRNDVIDKRDYKLFSEKLGMHFTGYYTEDLKHTDDKYLFFDILHRNNPKTAQLYLYDMDSHKLQYVRTNYKKFKEYYKILDYTDMIERFNVANKAIPVEVAIVDEAQDLTTLQWRMVWTAFRNCKRIYIAGDDDQAIYEWSGADVKYFLDLDGNVEILNKSYRLPSMVLNFSKNITRLIDKRVAKEYESTGRVGGVYHIRSLEELDFKTDKTWMILSRNRYFLKQLSEELQDKGLIYELNGELSISKKEVDLINTYEKCRKSGSSTEYELFKLQKHLKNGWTFNEPWFYSFDWEVDRINYIRNVIASKQSIDKCNIKIGTIHSVKGGEADNVVLLLSVTKQVYSNIVNNPDSEHRVFYVGATRAKENLYLLHNDYAYQYKIYEE